MGPNPEVGLWVGSDAKFSQDPAHLVREGTTGRPRSAAGLVDSPGRFHSEFIGPVLRKAFEVP